ncbi:hypothetical protein QYB55_001089 [Clostridium perfringens]|nr:hypothetical protein [Clostridium perfringens]
MQKELENYNIIISIEDLSNIEKVFSYYKGGIVPLKVIKQKTKLSYEEIHKLMTILVTKGILKPKYVIACDKNASTGASRIFDSLTDIPIKVCDRCNENCIVLENISVEFEVL